MPETTISSSEHTVNEGFNENTSQEFSLPPVALTRQERPQDRQGDHTRTNENFLEGESAVRNITIKKIYFYSGPNYYLSRACVVFNINFSPIVKEISLFKMKMAIVARFPEIADLYTKDLPELFAQALLFTQKMGINLCIDKYDVLDDDEEHSIAIEYLDEYVAEDAIYFVAQWFESIANPKIQFNFSAKFRQLQTNFDKSLFGGPTIYSLIEAGFRLGVPVNYLKIENVFQWGYGKKAIRGRSTVLDVDGIKDTEFTQLKDACKDFLLSCGFPTPIGKNCYSIEEAIAEAQNLGFPVVAKPLAGHKGQGVTTGIQTVPELQIAFQRIIEYHQKNSTPFQGCIVEQQIYGKDHRLLTIGGKFIAALEREPAFVIGDGINSIIELIRIENETNPNRSSNSRAPLAKIAIDQDLQDYLVLQNLTLNNVLPDGEKIYLRRVANISAGGLSTNVTSIMHPNNVKLAEDIASFFRVTCMGIDVMTDDISKPWQEGNFGIIEINAGPGVYMHLSPAHGGSIDVPAKLIGHFFPEPKAARIPIIIGNNLSLSFVQMLYAKLQEMNPKMRYFGAVVAEGAFLNGSYLVKNKRHDQNVEIILRHIGLDFAVFSHHRDDIHDYGIYHSGADIVILDNPNYAERTLERELIKGGYLIDVYPDRIELLDSEQALGNFPKEGKSTEEKLLEIITPLLEGLMKKYE